MTLTKDDLQSIRGVMREEVNGLRTEMHAGFENQSKSRERHFADLKELMKQSYVSREEFELVRDELQNEVDDLRKQVQSLQRKIQTA